MASKLPESGFMMMEQRQSLVALALLLATTPLSMSLGCSSDSPGTVSDDTPGETASPDAGVEASCNVACVNGACSNETLTCDCDVGYRGEACNELAPPPGDKLVLWLDANDPLADGSAPVAGALGNWVDKQGGLQFQAKPAYQPTLNTDMAVPVVVFDGVDDYLLAEGFDELTTQGSYSIVMIAATTGPDQAIIAGTKAFDEGHGLLIESDESDSLRFLHRVPYGYTGGNDYTTADGSMAGGLNLIWVEVNADTDNILIRSPGDGGWSIDTEVASLNEALDVTLGKLSWYQDSRFLDGGIGEILIFDGALDDDEASALSTYLEIKWAPAT